MDEFGWDWEYFYDRSVKDELEEHPTDQLIRELEDIPDEEM